MNSSGSARIAGATQQYVYTVRISLGLPAGFSKTHVGTEYIICNFSSREWMDETGPALESGLGNLHN